MKRKIFRRSPENITVARSLNGRRFEKDRNLEEGCGKKKFKKQLRQLILHFAESIDGASY